MNRRLLPLLLLSVLFISACTDSKTTLVDAAATDVVVLSVPGMH
jgi:hypothetical protein